MINTLDSRLGKVIGDYLIVRLGTELRDQGHSLTGELISSLEYQVQLTAKGMTVSFFASEYGQYLNTGVAAGRIPFSGISRLGGGKTSAYIQGLIRFVERRMNLRGKEGISVAFAIARAHKRDGMPTRGSFRYSKNGRRRGWVDTIITEDQDKIQSMVTEWTNREVTFLIHEFVKKAA
jgi:hypothetical protein